jgi:hypothetical protein
LVTTLVDEAVDEDCQHQTNGFILPVPQQVLEYEMIWDDEQLVPTPSNRRIGPPIDSSSFFFSQQIVSNGIHKIAQIL